jgi:hypothetical protein
VVLFAVYGLLLVLSAVMPVPGALLPSTSMHSRSTGHAVLEIDVASMTERECPLRGVTCA